jgi:hypothetical protein
VSHARTPAQGAARAPRHSSPASGKQQQFSVMIHSLGTAACLVMQRRRQLRLHVTLLLHSIVQATAFVCCALELGTTTCPVMQRRRQLRLHVTLLLHSTVQTTALHSCDAEGFDHHKPNDVAQV